MNRRRAYLITVALAVAAVVAACTLNPQPLPPGAPLEGEESGDAGFVSTVDGSPDNKASQDAAANPPPQGDGGEDAGDAGTDGGDAGDAG